MLSGSLAAARPSVLIPVNAGIKYGLDAPGGRTIRARAAGIEVDEFLTGRLGRIR
jgi:hypothetical protein